MTRRASGLVVFAALFSFTLPAIGQQYYLYSPKAADSETRVNYSNREILVSEILVKKGDTLSGISKKYSGKGSYYPQILLFNSIRNPNLIRIGESIRVPLKKASVGSAVTGSKKKAHTPQTDSTKTTKEIKVATPVLAAESSKSSGPQKEDRKPVASPKTDEQKLFDQGLNAYNAEDCHSAIELFDRMLLDFPNSPQAADAGLYKAECLLKLSGQ